MQNSPETRDDIRAAADAFGAKTVDYTRDSIVLQITDSSHRIDDFINLMRDYTILEICRTGVGFASARQQYSYKKQMYFK